MQSFGFTGYQMDSAGGLYFAQARRYDAGAGRFVSEDFLKGHIAVPYTMNHYNYCWNRPMDLNGMWSSLKDIGKGIKNAVSSVGEFVSDHKQQIAAAGTVANDLSCGKETSVKNRRGCFKIFFYFSRSIIVGINIQPYNRRKFRTNTLL